MYPHVPYSQPFIQPVCSEYNFSLKNEYPDIFVASKSNKYLPNEYIWIHLNIDNVKIKKKKSKNECLNIFVALKFNKNIYKLLYSSTNIWIYLNIGIFPTYCIQPTN